MAKYIDRDNDEQFDDTLFKKTLNKECLFPVNADIFMIKG